MAISGDFSVSAALASHPTNPLRRSPPPSRVGFNTIPRIDLDLHKCRSNPPWSFNLPNTKPINEETQGFLHNAINLTFLERLDLAWKILFPPPSTRRNSNANVAKQRLKMILFSDRCAVSDEAKQKIVSNIVGALSDFVEIEARDKVQLNVSTDPALGTVYSVTVPVRRVKAEYQDEDEFGMIYNVDYKDNGEVSGSVDVKFDFFLPNENM